jgi:hypothetical protein
MSLNPHRDIAEHIADNVSSLTEGENLFATHVQPAGPIIPSQAVFVFTSGGLPPLAFNGEGGVALRRPRVIIRVRTEKDDLDGGEDLANEVRDAVDFANISGYMDIVLDQHAPNFISNIDDPYPEWSIRLTAWYVE